jgi:hypothetical protein
MKINSIINIFILLIICSCIRNKGIQNTDLSEKETKYFSNISMFLNNNRILGKTIEEIKEKYGTPKEDIIESVRNKYEKNQNDEIHKILYDNLYLKMYRVNNSIEKKDYYLEIKISSNKYPIMFNIKIGENKDKIIHLFGNPVKDQNNELSYLQEDLGFTFKLNNNLIKEVIWIGYID